MYDYHVHADGTACSADPCGSPTLSRVLDIPPHCGKHAPGTCNGYGTECSPRHTPDEIMAHRTA